MLPSNTLQTCLQFMKIICSDDFIYKNKANLRQSDGSIKDYLTSFSKSTHDVSIL